MPAGSSVIVLTDTPNNQNGDNNKIVKKIKKTDHSSVHSPGNGSSSSVTDVRHFNDRIAGHHNDISGNDNKGTVSRNHENDCVNVHTSSPIVDLDPDLDPDPLDPGELKCSIVDGLLPVDSAPSATRSNHDSDNNKTSVLNASSFSSSSPPSSNQYQSLPSLAQSKLPQPSFPATVDMRLSQTTSPATDLPHQSDDPRTTAAIPFTPPDAVHTTMISSFPPPSATASSVDPALASTLPSAPLPAPTSSSPAISASSTSFSWSAFVEATSNTMAVISPHDDAVSRDAAEIFEAMDQITAVHREYQHEQNQLLQRRRSTTSITSNRQPSLLSFELQQQNQEDDLSPRQPPPLHEEDEEANEQDQDDDQSTWPAASPFSPPSPSPVRNLVFPSVTTPNPDGSKMTVSLTPFTTPAVGRTTTSPFPFGLTPTPPSLSQIPSQSLPPPILTLTPSPAISSIALPHSNSALSLLSQSMSTHSLSDLNNLTVSDKDALIVALEQECDQLRWELGERQAAEQKLNQIMDGHHRILQLTEKMKQNHLSEKLEMQKKINQLDATVLDLSHTLTLSEYKCKQLEYKLRAAQHREDEERDRQQLQPQLQLQHNLGQADLPPLLQRQQRAQLISVSTATTHSSCSDTVSSTSSASSSHLALTSLPAPYSAPSSLLSASSSSSSSFSAPLVLVSTAGSAGNPAPSNQQCYPLPPPVFAPVECTNHSQNSDVTLLHHCQCNDAVSVGCSPSIDPVISVRSVTGTFSDGDLTPDPDQIVSLIPRSASLASGTVGDGWFRWSWLRRACYMLALGSALRVVYRFVVSSSWSTRAVALLSMLYAFLRNVFRNWFRVR